jgi:ribulose-phosphate 3-epimerase
MPNPAPSIKLAPSILSADFARLGEEVALAVEAGVDYIHVDVMDGQFVPPITFGAQMVKAIKPYAKSVPLDVHLMVREPLPMIPSFADAGADILVVHAEAVTHLHRAVHAIKERGVRAGVAVNPGSPLALVEDVLPDLDLVLVMTVNPGYGGQPYIAVMEPKIARLRTMLDERGLQAELEVDGGINETTAPRAIKAGARVLVAGSAIYGRSESVKERVARVRASFAKAFG